ncbi:N(5)-glutamine methyltransferase-like protein MTQ2 [Cryomyces antarcticus]|nr:S-adenosylmethionine-dependent methyltransferase [Cryomyces antarcticus]
MLPTPSTSHVSFDNVYEPAEDSYLLLDSLSSSKETAFLHKRFAQNTSSGRQIRSPLVIEIGTGSGIVLAFVTAHADYIFGRSDLLTLGTDINSFACRATARTVQTACKEADRRSDEFRHTGVFLDPIIADLAFTIRPNTVDVLIFNPPYVPTPGLPNLSKHDVYNHTTSETVSAFDRDSHLLSLSYAGGLDGMETTDRLLEQLPAILSRDLGVAYILLCAQNKPSEVIERVREWEGDWMAESVAHSGKKGGWEKLQILRIWRTSAT